MQGKQLCTDVLEDCARQKSCYMANLNLIFEIVRDYGCFRISDPLITSLSNHRLHKSNHDKRWLVLIGADL